MWLENWPGTWETSIEFLVLSCSSSVTLEKEFELGSPVFQQKVLGPRIFWNGAFSISPLEAVPLFINNEIVIGTGT